MSWGDDLDEELYYISYKTERWLNDEGRSTSGIGTTRVVTIMWVDALEILIYGTGREMHCQIVATANRIADAYNIRLDGESTETGVCTLGEDTADVKPALE